MSTATAERTTADIMQALTGKRARRDALSGELVTCTRELEADRHATARALADGDGTNTTGNTVALTARKDALETALRLLDSDIAALEIDVKQSAIADAAFEEQQAKASAQAAVEATERVVMDTFKTEILPAVESMEAAFSTLRAAVRHHRNLSRDQSTIVDPVQRTIRGRELLIEAIKLLRAHQPHDRSDQMIE